MDEERLPVTISIIIAGDMPDTMERLERRRNLILHHFSDSAELESLLHKGLLNCDLILMRAPWVKGLFPASYSAGETRSYDLCLMDDPPSDEAWAELKLTMSELLRRARASYLHKMDTGPENRILRLRPGVVYADRDGRPGLALGPRRKFAETPAQEWMIRRVMEYDPLHAPEQDFVRELMENDLLQMDGVTPKEQREIEKDPDWRKNQALMHFGLFAADFQYFLREG